MLNAEAYNFNYLAWLNLVAAVLVCYAGVAVLVRERYTPVSWAFLAMTLSVAIWLFCVSFVVAAVNEAVAYRWVKLIYFGQVFIPAAILHFITLVLMQYERRKLQVRMAWVASIAFLALIVSTDFVFSELYRYPWGFYAKFNWTAIFFVGYLVFIFVVVLRMLAAEYIIARPGTMRWFRARGYMGMLMFAYLASADFLPACGVPFQPVGAVFVLISCALAARAIWRYRLVDVTPALAVNAIIDTMSDALLIVDPEGVIRHSNNAAVRMFCMQKSALEGKEAIEVLPSEKMVAGVDGLFKSRDAQSFETVYDGGTVGPRMLSVSASMIRDKISRPIAVVYTAQDVTDRRQAEEKIRFLAYYDPLTGLPNRTFYKEILGRAIAYAKRHKVIMATLFIDLDAFKNINDTLGHTAGDELLKAVAAQLTRCVRKTDYVARSEDERVPDTVSRLGGDEFIVLLNEIREGGDAARVAVRILDVLSRPFTVGGREVFISASIGISLYPVDGENVEDLLKNADAAMYVAKESGKNRYQFYTADLNAASRDRLERESDLRRAVKENEFVVYYHPRYELASGFLVGMEALVRWNHPDHGILLPEDFLSLAEETGSIISIGEQVLRAACRQAALWNAKGRKAVPVAVNLSLKQFGPRLMETIDMALEESGLPSHQLELEITESSIMQNPQKTLELLKACRAKGIRIVIDDFGTGYFCLSQLRHLPVDVLKIDRSFVMNITTSEDDASVARTIIAMGQQMKLKIVAEGVETAEQLEMLISFGCTEAQGFYLKKPLPADELSTVFEQEAYVHR